MRLQGQGWARSIRAAAYAFASHLSVADGRYHRTVSAVTEMFVVTNRRGVYAEACPIVTLHHRHLSPSVLL